MLAAGLISDIEVLKVGHHGSNSSSSLGFLHAARPEVAVISAGLNNQYGHPHPDLLSRLASVGTSLIYTDTADGDDSIMMTSDCQTYSFSAAPIPSTTSPRPTPTTASTVAADSEACGGAMAAIVGLDKVAEVVTLSASGSLTGWKIVSLTGGQTFLFPMGFVAAGTVDVKSGTSRFPSTSSSLWWTSSNVWNNSSGDDAALYDCNGQLVQVFDDGR